VARQPLYIAVGGNIGVGRELLTRYLAEEIGARPQYELLDSNPFFTRYYEDPRRWAFASQLCFLAQTFVQQCEIQTSVVPVVQARSMAEHFHVFVKSMHLRGYLTDEQLAELNRNYHSYAAVIRPPDLLVILRASLTVLEERIEKRGRPGEKVDRDYLTILEKCYDEWLAKYRSKNLSPILEIDTDEYDLHEADDRRRMIARVQRELLLADEPPPDLG
jgi:deoxyadenosine/deoxycytidine kinase